MNSSQILLVILIFLVLFSIPFLFYTFQNFLLCAFFLKSERLGFFRLIKKTWIPSTFWSFIMWFALTAFDSLPDNLFLRFLILFVFIGAVIGINYLSQRRITKHITEHNSGKKRFSLVLNIISVGFLLMIFLLNFPNKLILEKSEPDFSNRIASITNCYPIVKKLNAKLLNTAGVIYAQFNESEESIIIVKKINEEERKELFKNFSMTKMTSVHLDTSLIWIGNKQITDTTHQINLSTIQPKNIEQAVIYAYSATNGEFVVDIKTTYHSFYQGKTECKDNSEKEIYLDLLYDEASKNLFVKENFLGFVGP